MSDEFVVAIVGRPNVGKSALFNRMVASGTSIVHKESGVTRDRLYGVCRWGGQEFTLMDTGGIDLVSEDDMVLAIGAQVQQAVEEADALVFVVDVRSGLTRDDIDIAELLRVTRKPLLVAANKADVPEQDRKALEFYRLGFPDIFPVSAVHGLGVGEVLDRLLEIRGEVKGVSESSLDSEQDTQAIRVAIVGKPNVGKSSLVNAILGDERMTVSTRPGTTVDAVDTPFLWEDTQFILIDTAGLRRPKVIGERLEELSVGRALSAIRRSDVAVLVIDGAQGLSAQERRIAGFIRRNAKASVIVVNKKDLGLAGGASQGQYRSAALYQCRPIAYSKVLFTSCLTGEGVDRVIPEVARAYEEYGRRIETSALNELLTEATIMNPPPKSAKIYYGTQVGQRPPRMVFFVKDPGSMTDMYRRYLDGEIRKRFGFEGSPIVMEFRARQRTRRR
ncbi:MAG: ribosome biogenesis GTPase Der [Bacillota bacterium]|jgi:GTP-binding protein